ncbi:hypothetical protein B5K05_26305 [Rhizobium phaseoli]|nr:hypothetical protein B5K04_26235 [Rhizobium phaseoli]RDJ05297.1 hypothetical protein B5K05_26305 [Rhizobium phaseoli]
MRFGSFVIVTNVRGLDEQVIFAAFHRGSGRSCYSETFPKDGLITCARWVDIKEPAAAVEETIGWRLRTKE